jgi:hypothetical protein
MAESHREEIAKLEALYAGNPGGRVFVHLAEALRKAGEHPRARSILEEGLARHSDSASGYVVLGRLLTDVQAYAEAEAAFRRVLELDGGNLIALRGIADLALEAGRTHDAIACYRELLARNPSSDDVRQLLSRLEATETQTAAEGPGDVVDQAAAAGWDDGWTPGAAESEPAAADERDAAAPAPGEPAAPYAAAPGDTGDAAPAEVEYGTVDLDALPGDLGAFTADAAEAVLPAPEEPAFQGGWAGIDPRDADLSDLIGAGTGQGGIEAEIDLSDLAGAELPPEARDVDPAVDPFAEPPEPAADTSLAADALETGQYDVVEPAAPEWGDLDLSTTAGEEWSDDGIEGYAGSLDLGGVAGAGLEPAQPDSASEAGTLSAAEAEWDGIEPPPAGSELDRSGIEPPAEATESEWGGSEPSPEAPEPAWDVAGEPADAWDVAGEPEDAWDVAGEPEAAWDVAGEPEAAWDVAGEPEDAWDVAGEPEAAWDASQQAPEPEQDAPEESASASPGWDTPADMSPTAPAAGPQAHEAGMWEEAQAREPGSEFPEEAQPAEPGLDEARAPEPGPEGEEVQAAEAGPAVWQAVESAEPGPAVWDESDAEHPGTIEAPVSAGDDLVTETMADLYRRQGLLDLAAETYRALLRHRPGDAALLARLRELEEETGPPAAQTEAEPLPGAGTATADEEAGDVWLAELGSAWTGRSGSDAEVEATPYAWSGAMEEDTGAASAEAAPDRPIGAYLHNLVSWRPEPREDVVPADAEFHGERGAVPDDDVTDAIPAELAPLGEAAETMPADLEAVAAGDGSLPAELEPLADAAADEWGETAPGTGAEPEGELELEAEAELYAGAELDAGLELEAEQELGGEQELEAGPEPESGPEPEPVDDESDEPWAVSPEDEPWAFAGDEASEPWSPGVTEEREPEEQVQEEADARAAPAAEVPPAPLLDDVEAAFNEWFNGPVAGPRQPSTATAADTAGGESDSGRVAETGQEAEDDEDLAMFRSWLQSLKK